MSFVLAIDQGTTSSRAILFDARTIRSPRSRSRNSRSTIPASGWVEHEPEDIWTTTVADLRATRSRRRA